MRVTLTKHGGLGAGLRRKPLIMEASALSDVSAKELGRLVVAVKSEPTVDTERPGRARDEMSYTVTVEERSGETTVIRQSDTAMSPGFAALLQWLEVPSESGSPSAERPDDDR